jgi:hypothetical protein
MRLRTVVILFPTFFVLAGFLLSSLRLQSDASIANSSGAPRWFGAQTKGDLENPFQDIDTAEMARAFASDQQAPAGNWLVAALPDHNQRTNAKAPVSVINTVSFLATGKITNLIVAGVTLLNAAHQPVKNNSSQMVTCSR